MPFLTLDVPVFKLLLKKDANRKAGCEPDTKRNKRVQFNLDFSISRSLTIEQRMLAITVLFVFRK